MKKILIVAFILIFKITFCQNEYNNGEIKIKYIKSKKVSLNFNLTSYTKYKGANLEKIRVTCKFKSLTRKRVDINKISLIDKKNKIRYRPSDITFQPFTAYEEYTKLLKEDVKIKGVYAYAFYKPEIKDSFEGYLIDGYSIFELQYEFGSKKNPITSYIYFEKHQFLKFKAFIFFPLKENAENPELELYYGNDKISEIEI